MSNNNTTPPKDPQFMRPVYTVIADLRAAVAGNVVAAALVAELCRSIGKPQ